MSNESETIRMQRMRQWTWSAALVLMVTLLPSTASAQVATGDSVRAWYDTLEVERPRYARATMGERLALSAFTALALPVALTVGAITLFPPTINVLHEHGQTHVGVTAGTGWGIGGDTTAFIYFPDVRMQVDIGYYLGRDRRIMGHVSFLKDARLVSIHPRDFFWVAVAGGVGVATDIHSVEPYAEGWVGFLNPMGIRYAPLFPMHHYGVRGRIGYDPASSQPWYEVSFGVTSTFGF